MKKEQTTIRKSIHIGWIAETNFVSTEVLTDGNKVASWKVSTNKTSRGGVASTAQFGHISRTGTFTGFSFIVFQDPSHNLIHDPSARCTEKTVLEQHKKAIEKFLELEPSCREEVKITNILDEDATQQIENHNFKFA